MRVDRIDQGLWRWTGLHPEWKAGDGWEQEVGCVYYEAAEAVVLVDPLLPPEEPERFLEALDRDIERVGLPVSVQLTCPWHRRSADELAGRYGGTVDGPVGDVEPLPLGSSEERLVWLPGPRALVTGDALLVEGGRLRVCPPSWVGDGAWPSFRESLHAAARLPVERLLVSHGEPVLSGAREALAAALATT